MVAGEVDGVETTDAFDEEDSEDGSRAPCEQLLAAEAVDGDADDVLSIHEIISLSIIESIFSRAVVVGFDEPGFDDVVGTVVGVLLAASGVGLLLEMEVASRDGGIVGGDVDEAVDVDAVVDEVVPFEFCWCNRLRRRSRVSFKRV